MGTFFELWKQFDPPKGTKKASLSEERELYELIRDTKIEARFSLMDLYGFLHFPFQQKNLILFSSGSTQWKQLLRRANFQIQSLKREI